MNNLKKKLINLNQNPSIDSLNLKQIQKDTPIEGYSGQYQINS